MTTAAELLDLIALEAIERDIFRGQNEENFGPRLFGGQVMAQAVAAASATVEATQRGHSLHGYFLRPGDTRVPVLYRVERIRDGRSFVTRRIVAIQNGQAIFSMDMSFHTDEPGLTHQIDMKDYPSPDELEEDRVTITRIDPAMATSGWARRERGFDLKSVFPLDTPRPTNEENPVWLRFHEPIPESDPRNQMLLAYASDMGFVSTAFLRHRDSHTRDEIQMASLDHAMWFHKPFTAGEWLLYVKESTNAGRSRGYNRGGFYTRDGELVASSMQEGLMRVRSETPRA